MTTPRTERIHGSARQTAALASVLVALAVATPSGARAAAGPTGLANSRHNLSATSGNVVRATIEGNSCKFCHTPHRAQATRALWNHRDTAQGTFSWGTDAMGEEVLTTRWGTPLPRTSIRPASRRCLGCHDGSISIGDVMAGNDGVPILMATVSGRTDASGRLQGNAVVGSGGYLGGEHPVSIPYAGEQNYNDVNSEAGVDDAVKGKFWSVRTAGCASPSGVCTSGGSNGAAINLLPQTTGTTTNVGVECTTCHEPHNRWGFPKLMRVDTAYDALCKSCHNK